MRSILMLQKTWDADAKFAKEVSAPHKKGKMQMQLYMIGGVKSICGSEYQDSADTSAPKRASAEANIKIVQIHQLPKKHLQRRINRGYRYIRYQKSKSPHSSSYFNHDTPQSKKRLCNPANWSRACPAKLSRSAQSFLAGGVEDQTEIFRFTIFSVHVIVITSFGDYLFSEQF